MALKAYALTTRARLIDFLGLTAGDLSAAQEAILDNLINSVTESIERELGYRVKLTTYTEELYDTDDGRALVLKSYPISEAHSVTIGRRSSGINEDDWETVDSQYYHIDYEAGIIYAAAGIRFFRTRQGYRVTYTAGYDFDNSLTFLSDTQAGDLELAAWQLAQDLWDVTGGQASDEVESESIGDYSVKYARAKSRNSVASDIIIKYARPMVGGVQTPYVY